MLELLYRMSKDFEALKADIRAMYPGQDLTDAELDAMAERLIRFFAIGAQAVRKAKRHKALIDLHEARKGESEPN